MSIYKWLLLIATVAVLYAQRGQFHQDFQALTLLALMCLVVLIDAMLLEAAFHSRSLRRLAEWKAPDLELEARTWKLRSTLPAVSVPTLVLFVMGMAALIGPEIRMAVMLAAIGCIYALLLRWGAKALSIVQPTMT